MSLILTGLEVISREAVKVEAREEVLEVYRDPAGNVVRFHILITPTLRLAEVAVLAENRWTPLHHLLVVRRVEDSLARLFSAAAAMLAWPGSQESEGK